MLRCCVNSDSRVLTHRFLQLPAAKQKAGLPAGLGCPMRSQLCGAADVPSKLYLVLADACCLWGKPPLAAGQGSSGHARWEWGLGCCGPEVWKPWEPGAGLLARSWVQGKVPLLVLLSVDLFVLTGLPSHTSLNKTALGGRRKASFLLLPSGEGRENPPGVGRKLQIPPNASPPQQLPSPEQLDPLATWGRGGPGMSSLLWRRQQPCAQRAPWGDVPGLAAD